MLKGYLQAWVYLIKYIVMVYIVMAYISYGQYKLWQAWVYLIKYFIQLLPLVTISAAFPIYANVFGGSLQVITFQFLMNQTNTLVKCKT